MPTLLDALISYVPWLVAKQFVDDPSPLSEAHTEQFEAAVFFADISGFSKLAKHLSSQEGLQGPEHLTVMLNRYFGALIDLIWQHGGDVVKFAGDAIYAVWPTIAHQETLQTVSHAAVQCALITQKQLKNYTLETGHILSLRIGVAAGHVTATSVGGILKRWELLLVGHPIGQVNTASTLASKGEVVVSDAVYQLLKSDLVAEPIHVPEEEQPFWRVSELLKQKTFFPISQPNLAPEASRALSGFVAGAITSRLNANQDEWVAENRRVSIIFIQLSGITQTTSDLIEHMHKVMRSMQLGLYHHEGSVRQFIIDDKGTIFIAVFGIPPLTHEDDPLRAVKAAYELRQKINELGYSCKVGISTGLAFCGPVGNRIRREYAIVGDVVILAARLMGIAPPNTILCDFATYQYIRNYMRVSEQPALPLKGFDEPVRIFLPIFDEIIDQNHDEVLGREDEITQLENILREVKDGESKAVLLSGDDGSGKSGVLETLMRSARHQGFRVLFGKGEFVDRASPYHGWSGPLSAIFEVSNLSKTRSRSLTILAKLAIEPQLARLAPLLNSILPLDIPENDETNAMTGEIRAENTRWLLMQILSLHSRDRPMLIVLDDAHWMDSASWALARTVAQRMPSVMMVLSFRSGNKLPNEALQLRTLPQTIEIELQPLSREQTAKLIARRLDASTVSERITDIVFAKAHGNLLFTDQLIYAMRDGGYIENVNGHCRLRAEIKTPDELAIPSTLRDVMTARIDRLPPNLQLTLKVASVIGESFLYQTLQDIFPIADERHQVDVYLEDLQALDLVERVSSEDIFQFKQRLVRDVAYDLMAFAQRKELHLEIAKWFERNYVYDLSPFYALLAYHWQQGGNNKLAIDYYEKAAQKARYDGAYAEVIDFLEQAEMLEQNINSTRRLRWSELLGEAHWGIGNLDDSEFEFKEILKNLGLAWPQSVRAVYLGILKQALTQILHRFLPRLFTSHDTKRHQTLLQIARALRRLQEIYYFKNQGILSFYAGIYMLNIAERVGRPTPELAIARSNFVVSLGLLRWHRQAQYYAAQVMRQIEQQDKQTVAAVYTRLGLYHAARGEWQVATDYIQYAINLYRQLGDITGSGEALALLGFTQLLQGQLTLASAQFDQLEQVAAISSNREYTAWAIIGRASLSALRGDFQAAYDMGLAAQQLLQATTDRAAYLNNLGVLAYGAVRLGDFSSAEAYLKDIDTALAKRALLNYVGAGAYTYRILAALWIRQQNTGAIEVKQLQYYLKALKRFSRTFSILQPRYYILQALASRFIYPDSSKPMIKTLRRALQLAERKKMAYEKAIAEFYLGRVNKDQLLLDSAQQYFDQMGITIHESDNALFS